MISILLPSRGRPAQLERFLDSVEEYADKPHRVEVIVRLDEDDTAPYKLETLARSNVKALVGPAGAGMGRMTNECFALASGHIIMLAGDDMVFRTDGFDTMVKALMPHDGIGLVYGNDLLQGEGLATHPFIGRATINAWGGQVVPDEYGAEYIDTHIMDTFARLARMGHQRMLYVPDLITEHLHYLNGKAAKDETYTNKPMGLRESCAVYEALAPQREHDADAMRRVIEGA